MFVATEWTNVVVPAMLGVIMMARLYAMYQRSRTVLILLIIVLLAVTIANGAMNEITNRYASGEVYILFGTYECAIDYGKSGQLLMTMIWMLIIVWEVLALWLAVRIAVKHFRELRQSSAGGIIGDCFTVLMRTHMAYFASFAAASGLQQVFTMLSKSQRYDQYSLQNQILAGVAQILSLTEMFVLEPRLILDVREYNARRVADSDAATTMTSIAFQERVHVSTSSIIPTEPELSFELKRPHISVAKTGHEPGERDGASTVRSLIKAPDAELIVEATIGAWLAIEKDQIKNTDHPNANLTSTFSVENVDIRASNSEQGKKND
ncbi:uncharacterized protein EDB91DRAFT_1257735 [Suillus paluster]|uniref:uncharacterized protein n=1 Tax=Suillus paluster TaxID=48578 RepID=UPI001B86C74C|nr:uncharacterized protein EDB91DRAFT_1257735 [Suillus paluster]KAG1719340.1 hypothetical protein EDB91DRAFT_1257735 [Suillus paluster]